MVDNVYRAKWAEAALELFAEMVMPGEVTEETAQDLVCDVGHYCRLQLRLSRDETLALYATAIGCWVVSRKWWKFFGGVLRAV